jgi:hypothetical protein
MFWSAVVEPQLASGRQRWLEISGKVTPPMLRSVTFRAYRVTVIASGAIVLGALGGFASELK